MGREVAMPGNLESQLRAYRSWVYVCSTKNSSTVAQVPLSLFAVRTKPNEKFLFPTRSVSRETMDYLWQNKGLIPYLNKGIYGAEEIISHPYLDLMKNVNKFMNQFDLWEKTQLHLELVGNAYWYIVKNNLGIPVEIWIVPPQRMQVVPDRTEFIKGYIYSSGMEKVPFTEDEIIHFKFPHPNNPYYGMSPLEAVSHAYNINENMSRYENAVFTNMARPDGTLTTEQSLSDTQFKRLEEQWQQKYGRTSKAGKTAVLEAGLKFQQIQLSPRELSFLVGRKLTKEEIIAAYGVPISKVTTEDVNLANAKVGERQYMKDTINPRLRRNEQKINEKFMPMYDERLFVAFKDPVPEDMEFLLKERESNLKTGYTFINQEREKNNLDPVDWGDKPIMQNIMVPLVTTPPTETPAPIPPGKVLRFFSEQQAEVLANMKKYPMRKSQGNSYFDKWLFGQRTWTDKFGSPKTINYIVTQLRESLTEGMEINEGMGLLRQRVRDVFSKVKDNYLKEE